MKMNDHTHKKQTRFWFENLEIDENESLNDNNNSNVDSINNSSLISTS